MSPSSLLRSLDLRGGSLPQVAVIAGFLVAAVALGGASGAGITANAVLQLAGVIGIAAIAMRGWATPLAPAERDLLALAAVFGLLYVLQCVPLPPALWAALPGRAIVADGLDTLAIPRPWMPLSLTPAGTVRSGVALLAPIAMLLMVMRFQRTAARAGVLALLAMMIVSVILGVAQFSGGGPYLYAYANQGNATGFFPNANHFGTLMCLSMPLAAGLVARGRSGGEGRGNASRVFGIAVLLGFVLLGLLGIAMTASVAGMLLAVLAIIGCAAIMMTGLSKRLRLGFLGGVVLVVLVAGFVVFTKTSAGFATNNLDIGTMSRPGIWSVTRRAIDAFGLAGSGFGSFPQVFPLFEDARSVTNLFANHAHNDLLELVLEGGVPAIALLVAFLVWFVRRLLSIWLTERRRDALAQGASIAATIVLLHSLVDYPLRTGAISVVFGLCLGLMARSATAPAPEVPAEAPTLRHVSA